MMVFSHLIKHWRFVVNSKSHSCTRHFEGFKIKHCKKLYNQNTNMSSQATISNVDENMVWIDMEMTGLDVAVDQILEVACIITDGELNVIAEFPSMIINQPIEVLSRMNDWCTRTHMKSGLTNEVLKSQITLEDAEKKLYDFIEEYIPPGKCPLAGNSVYMDRLFLKKHMPRIDNHLHYRIVDVSTIKELCRRWYPTNYKTMLSNKTIPHRALEDIKGSIDELNYYRSTVFKDLGKV